MAGRTLTIDIKTADAQTLAALKRIQKELKDTGQVADRTSKQGLSLGGALGGLAIGAGISKSIGEFEEAETTLRKTEAVIKSTGNAAGVSAEQQAKMVEQFSKLAAVDDEVVAGGANILRTFTQIKGEAFEPALGAALDLSAALGTDLQSASLQVGKALNDPTKGVTALTRAGVSFTAQQKEQIKAMQAAGDTAGAQKLILAELENQFGGQAEAAATDSARMRIAFDDAAESLGGALAPALAGVADVAQKASAAFQDLPPGLQQAALAGGALAIVGPKIAEGWTAAAQAVGASRAALAGSVSDFGLVKSGALGAAAGLTAYNAAYEYLESLTTSDTDLPGLAKDLELVAAGASDLEPVFQSAGGTAEGMAQKVRDLLGSFDESGAERFGDVLASFQNADPGQLWGDLTEALGEGIGRQAQQDIEDLDTALAAFAAGSPQDAKKVFGDMVNALIEQGLTVEQISGLFPQYRDEIERSEKAVKAGIAPTNEMTGSVNNLAGAMGGFLANAEQYADANDAVASAGEAVNQAVVGVADAQDRVAQAEQGVADAERSVADASEQVASAREGVAAAEEGLADARRGVADALEDVTDAEKGALAAREDVTQATLDLAQAQQDALIDSEYMADALEGVTDAEERLADSQADSQTAQEALTEARAGYGDVLEDLATKAAGAADDVLSAGIRLRDAEQALADLGKPDKDGKAEPVTADEKLAAEIAVREAQRRLAEAEKRATEAAEEEKRQREAGVNGSDAVVAAKDEVAAAAERQQEAEENLTDAVQTVADKQEEANGRVEQAQRDLTSAIDDRIAADQRVIDAKQGVIDANGLVQKAAEGVRDANRDVAGAVDNVRDAQKRVTDAKDGVVKARDAVRDAERDVEKAVKDQYKAYQDLSELFAPGSAARTRMEWVTGQMQAQYGFLTQPAPDYFTSIFGGKSGPGGKSEAGMPGGKSKGGNDAQLTGSNVTTDEAAKVLAQYVLYGGEGLTAKQKGEASVYLEDAKQQLKGPEAYKQWTEALTAFFAGKGGPADTSGPQGKAVSKSVTINVNGSDDPAAIAEWAFKRAGWELDLMGAA